MAINITLISQYNETVIFMAIFNKIKDFNIGPNGVER